MGAIMKKYMFMIFMILMTGVFATTIYIPEDYATIQEGIDASEDGDEIIVSPGAYVENINFLGKAIILGSLFYTTQDTSYISQTIIDGNQDGSVVIFENEEDSTSLLIGFTITNGLAGGWGSYGGGITCNSSSPSLVNVTITGNSADWGGGILCFPSSSPSLENVTIRDNSAESGGAGIYCYFSSPSLENVTIRDNSAGYVGGGIYCYSSSPSLANVTIMNNSSESNGGGIYCVSYSSPSLVNVTITGNSAGHSGGGIYCFDVSSPIIENVMITGNSAEDDGGGIYCEYSSPSLVNVTITGNSADNGGGIYCFWVSSPSLENVTITGNSAHDGGGIYCIVSSASLENVTITNNSAGNSGGGIYCIHSSPSLENVTITNNSAGNSGGGIFCRNNSSPIIVNCILWNNSPQEIEFYDDSDPNTITIAYSDIAGGEEGIETHNNGTVYWLEGNIDENPLFMDALVGNYHLTEDSPCIDTGTSYFEYEGEILVDLSEDEYYGIAPDMGAYEYGLVSAVECKIENVKCKIKNYPNPFNPETNIVFEMSAGSNVLMEIYNIKGQKVTTLINGPFEAGSHKVTWNATDQSSGIYLLRFNTAETSEMKKLILLK